MGSLFSGATKNIKKMTKKITLEVTEAQLSAIVAMTDECSAMLGGADDDTLRIKWVRLIDRMLQNNGYKRKNK